MECLAQGTVILAVENSWPPYSDKQGNGISNDRVKKAFNSVNVKVIFVVVPYARALRMAELGQVDGAFNVAKQKSTLQRLNFGKHPIFRTTASYYYHRQSTMEVDSVADIANGSTIGLILGYEYGDEYEKHKHRFKEVRVATQKQIIELLLKKRIDLALMFDEVAQYTLTEMKLPPTAIKKGKINQTSEIYVAFSKIKNTKKLLRLLDKGLSNLKVQNGQIKNNMPM